MSKSRKDTMIAKLGSEEAYRKYMAELARRSHINAAPRRTKDTVASLRKRIYVVAEQEGVEVRVEVKHGKQNAS